MKLERKVSVHNCFEVEVRDAKTGEVKERGRAENIVLNNWKLFSIPFRIYFGSGVDESQENVNMNGLIEYVGYKSLTQVSSTWEGEYRIVGFQSEEVKANEYVGKRFAEVGIYDGSKLISHAFIRDSEGNLLSFVKKDTDVVVFYATVYYHMAGIRFKSHPPLGNSFNGTQWLVFGDKSNISCANTVTKEEERRYACTKQIQNDVLNGVEIRGMVLGAMDFNDVIIFPTQGLYEGTTITKEKLSGMNGEVKNFDLKWNAGKDIRIYKNNVLLNAESDYTLNTNIKKKNNLLKLASDVSVTPDFTNDSIKNLGSKKVTIPFKEIFMAILKGENVGLLAMYYYGDISYGDLGDYLFMEGLSEYTVDLSKEVDVNMFSLNYGSGEGTYTKVTIEVYRVGQWETIYDGSGTSINHQELSEIKRGVSKVRVKLSEPRDDRIYKRIPWVKVEQNLTTMITFQNAPLATDVLEADYTVAYVPKDENHVLKLNYDLIMTPGVSG